MENALVKKNFGTVQSLFAGQYVQEQLKAALPSMMNVDQLVRISLTVIRQNEKLLKCSPQSLLSCVMGCASLGLSPEPYLGQAYFVPFWNSKLNSYESTFMPGYRGYITLAKRSGELKNLAAQMVYEKDFFKVQWGLNEVLEHVPVEGDRGDYRGAWVVLKYINGDPTFEYMPIHDINAIKERTKSRNKAGQIVGPWITDFAEMAKKTVIRRHIKLAPLSIEDNRIVKAAHAENLAIDGAQGNFFLPDSTPLELTTEPEPEPDGITFEDAVGSIANDPGMADFLKTVADANNIDIDGVKAETIKNPEPFINAYLKFAADNAKPTATAKKDEPAPKDEKKSGDIPQSDLELLNTFVKLRGGFREWMENPENLASVQAAGGIVLEKAKDKWDRLVGYAWPGDEKVDKGEGEDNQEGEKVDPAPSGGLSEAGQRDLDWVKAKHFKHYAELTRGRAPKTDEEVENLIANIQTIVFDESQKGA